MRSFAERERVRERVVVPLLPWTLVLMLGTILSVMGTEELRRKEENRADEEDGGIIQL